MNLVVIVESARTLITHSGNDDTNTLHVPSLIAVGAALGECQLVSRTPSLADERCRREVFALPLLLRVPEHVEPGPHAVGGPPQRPVHQWLR